MIHRLIRVSLETVRVDDQRTGGMTRGVMTVFSGARVHTDGDRRYFLVLLLPEDRPALRPVVHAWKRCVHLHVRRARSCADSTQQYIPTLLWSPSIRALAFVMLSKQSLGRSLRLISSRSSTSRTSQTPHHTRQRRPIPTRRPCRQRLMGRMTRLVRPISVQHHEKSDEGDARGFARCLRPGLLFFWALWRMFYCTNKKLCFTRLLFGVSTSCREIILSDNSTGVYGNLVVYCKDMCM
jgi:hypothetical protein